MTQAQQAQKFREQQEEMRRRHIDELRSKDMDRRAQVDYSCILVSKFDEHLHFLRSRRGDGTLRSLSRSVERQSWLGTRSRSPGWRHRGGAAEATLSLLSAVPLPDSSSLGWTLPRGIGAAGGKIFLQIRLF